MNKEEKIVHGKNIQGQISLLRREIRKKRDECTKEINLMIDQIDELRNSCQHSFKWYDTNPYCEDCRCIYCDEQSDRTR